MRPSFRVVREGISWLKSLRSPRLFAAEYFALDAIWWPDIVASMSKSNDQFSFTRAASKIISHQLTVDEAMNQQMKRMTRNLTLVAILSYCALLASCATAPMSSDSGNSEAMKFTPEPGKANIYLIRHSWLGQADAYLVEYDGKFVGTLVPGTYQLFDESPGNHTLAVNAGPWKQEEKITVDAGKNYFYDVSVRRGWSSNTVKIVSLPEQQGRQWVMSSKRAAIIKTQTEHLINTQTP